MITSTFRRSSRLIDPAMPVRLAVWIDEFDYKILFIDPSSRNR
jgi:hypothetical protein